MTSSLRITLRKFADEPLRRYAVKRLSYSWEDRWLRPMIGSPYPPLLRPLSRELEAELLLQPGDDWGWFYGAYKSQERLLLAVEMGGALFERGWMQITRLSVADDVTVPMLLSFSAIGECAA